MPSLASTVLVKRNKYYSIGFPVCHNGTKGNEKADSAAKAGLLRIVPNVPITFSDFKKHINVLIKHKWQAEWDEAINKKNTCNTPSAGSVALRF